MLDQYAKRYGFDSEIEYEDFMFIMQALDDEFLKVSRKQTPTKTGGAGATSQ